MGISEHRSQQQDFVLKHFSIKSLENLCYEVKESETI